VSVEVVSVPRPSWNVEDRAFRHKGSAVMWRNAHAPGAEIEEKVSQVHVVRVNGLASIEEVMHARDMATMLNLAHATDGQYDLSRYYEEFGQS